MHDHVVHKPHGHLKESPVETEGTVTAARTPAESQVSKLDAGWWYPGSTREKLHPPHNPFSALSDIPASEVLGGMCRRISPEAKASAVEHQHAILLGDHNKPIRPTYVPESLSVDELWFAGLGRQCFLEAQLPMNPKQLCVRPTREILL